MGKLFDGIGRILENCPSLYYLCLFGTAGVLLDLDHFWAVIQGYKYSDYRWFHTPMLYISGFILCLIGACVIGLYLKYFLKR